MTGFVVENLWLVQNCNPVVIFGALYIDAETLWRKVHIFVDQFLCPCGEPYRYSGCCRGKDPTGLVVFVDPGHPSSLYSLLICVQHSNFFFGDDPNTERCRAKTGLDPHMFFFSWTFLGPRNYKFPRRTPGLNCRRDRIELSDNHLREPVGSSLGLTFVPAQTLGRPISSRSGPKKHDPYKSQSFWTH